MVIQDQMTWLKAGFELTEIGVKRLLTVATNQLSDDANGCILEDSEVWIQIARKGMTLAVHYSLDDAKYDMLRVCSLPLNETVKVGLEAQCSTGEGIYHTFKDVSLEKKTITDIWSGK